MEPALRDGDVILVRRADFPRLHQWWRRRVESVAGDKGEKKEPTPREEEERRRDEVDLKKARRIARRDNVGADVDVDAAAVISRPVQLLPGDLVLFQSPRSSFPSRYNVKRVVAMGGQRVRAAGNLRTVEYVPGWGLWVEGDNAEESDDSGSYGALNGKMVVGKAERVLWPPSRWGPVERRRPRYGRTWWTD